MPSDPLKHLLSHPEIGSHRRKVILGRPSAAGICRHKRRVPQRVLNCSRPPKFFTLFSASAGSLPCRLHNRPDYRSKNHKTLSSSLHRISDFSYKTLVNCHANHKGNNKRPPSKSRASTTASVQYSRMKWALAFHVPVFTHVQRDI